MDKNIKVYYFTFHLGKVLWLCKLLLQNYFFSRYMSVLFEVVYFSEAFNKDYLAPFWASTLSKLEWLGSELERRHKLASYWMNENLGPTFCEAKKQAAIAWGHALTHLQQVYEKSKPFIKDLQFVVTKYADVSGCTLCSFWKPCTDTRYKHMTIYRRPCTTYWIRGGQKHKFTSMGGVFMMLVTSFLMLHERLLSVGYLSQITLVSQVNNIFLGWLDEVYEKSKAFIKDFQVVVTKYVHVFRLHTWKVCTNTRYKPTTAYRCPCITYRIKGSQAHKFTGVCDVSYVFWTFTWKTTVSCKSQQ